MTMEQRYTCVEKIFEKDDIARIMGWDSHAYGSGLNGVDYNWYKRYVGKAKLIYLHDTQTYECKGYSLTCHITKDLYEAYMNGVLAGDVSVSPSMFKSEGDYSCICSIVTYEPLIIPIDEYLHTVTVGSFYAENKDKGGNKYLVALVTDNQENYKVFKYFYKMGVGANYTVCFNKLYTQ